MRGKVKLSQTAKAFKYKQFEGEVTQSQHTCKSGNDDSNAI